MASASRSATPFRRCAASRWSSSWTRGRHAGPKSRPASTLGAQRTTHPAIPTTHTFTTRPHLCRLARVCSEVSEYPGESIMNGHVHGCTGYTHTKGERGLSLEFTHSILSGLKTAGILTRLVRCALAPHAPPNLKPAVPPRYRFLSPLPPTASPGPHTLYSHPTRKRSYDMSSLFHAFPPTHPPSFPSYALPLLALCRITACPSCRP